MIYDENKNCTIKIPVDEKQNKYNLKVQYILSFFNYKLTDPTGFSFYPGDNSYMEFNLKISCKDALQKIIDDM